MRPRRGSDQARRTGPRRTSCGWASSRDEGNQLFQADFLVTIRDDDHLVESIAYVFQGHTLFTIRRAEVRRPPRAAMRLGPGRAAIPPSRRTRAAAEVARADPRRHGPAQRHGRARWRSGRTTRCTSSATIRAGRTVGRSWTSSTCPARRIACSPRCIPRRTSGTSCSCRPIPSTRTWARRRTRASCSTPRPRASRCGATRTSQQMAEILLSSIGATGLFSGPPAKDRTVLPAGDARGDLPRPRRQRDPDRRRAARAGGQPRAGQGEMRAVLACRGRGMESSPT